MKNVTKTLLVATLAGASFLGAAALQANPTHDGLKAQQRSGEMMSGGSMINEPSGGTMGMMQQMSQMMETCNKMMKSHEQNKKESEPAHAPAG